MICVECIICKQSSLNTRIIKYKDGCYYCRKHYLQMYKKGYVYETIYDKNEIVFHKNYAELILKNKNGIEVAKTKIDLEDVNKVKSYKWHIKKGERTSYVISRLKNGKGLFLHRLVLNYDGDLDVDHIDHDGLNNQKSNLRIVSHSLNLMNQHNDNNGIKTTPSGRYSANITVNGKSIYLGTFDTYEEAKRARKQYEKTIFSKNDYGWS